MKKIIVLGATGRIGKLLLPLLTDQGHGSYGIRPQ